MKLDIYGESLVKARIESFRVEVDICYARVQSVVESADPILVQDVASTSP